jgi:hypothetical protein
VFFLAWPATSHKHVRFFDSEETKAAHTDAPPTSFKREALHKKKKSRQRNTRKTIKLHKTASLVSSSLRCYASSVFFSWAKRHGENSATEGGKNGSRALSTEGDDETKHAFRLHEVGSGRSPDHQVGHLRSNPIQEPKVHRSSRCCCPWPHMKRAHILGRPEKGGRRHVAHSSIALLGVVFRRLFRCCDSMLHVEGGGVGVGGGGGGSHSHQIKMMGSKGA